MSETTATETDMLTLVGNALDGSRGADQRRIAQVGLDWLCTLLRKNQDYGSSAWKRPVLAPHLDAAEAILVRMSDKIERLTRLLEHRNHVKEETYDDSMKDLGAYALLYLARPREVPHEQRTADRPGQPVGSCLQE